MPVLLRYHNKPDKFRTAVTNKHGGDNLVVDIRIPVAGKAKRAYQTDNQCNILRDALQEKRQYAFVLTMLCTGMRMGEATSLLRDDVDLHLAEPKEDIKSIYEKSENVPPSTPPLDKFCDDGIYKLRLLTFF